MKMAFLPHVVPVGLASASTDVLVLHGILGSGRNLRTFAQRLVQVHPSLRLWLVDLRNHGDSQGAPPPHTIQACCDDLDALVAARGIRPAWIIGHSYGGKVAVAWTGRAPAGLIHTWVLDSPPAGYAMAQLTGGDAADNVERVITTLRQIPLPLANRRAVVGEFTQRGFPDSIGQWMTTNVRETADGYRWVFDLDAIDEMLVSYLATDTWPILESPPPGVQIDVIRAERSKRWPPEVLARFAAITHGRSRLHMLPDAGHWLHVERTDALVALMTGLI
jgi:pimeloyl-ACP methyl ester carboxylesterase